MKSKVLAIVATSAAVLALSVGNVFAWTYAVHGVGKCASNGSFGIDWTVDNTAENEPLIITSSSSPSVVAPGTQIPANKTADFSQTVDGTKPGNFSLSLTGHFPSDHTDRTQTANVKLDQACAQPTPPVYTCDLLKVTPGDNRTVTVSAFRTSAANGAVFKNAVLNWGDSSAPLTTANVVGQTHQYAQDGTYTIAAVAHFTVNGKDVTADGAACTQKVTFRSKTPPTVTPPPTTPATPAPPAAAAPTELVNTGPGSIIGIFTAATAAGAIAYRYRLVRKLNQ